MSRTPPSLRLHSPLTCAVIAPDKPSRPEGPLLAKVADQESVTLDWQPPADDGGCDIAGYFIEKFDSKKQTWMKVRRWSQRKAYFRETFFSAYVVEFQA